MEPDPRRNLGKTYQRLLPALEAAAQAAIPTPEADEVHLFGEVIDQWSSQRRHRITLADPSDDSLTFGVEVPTSIPLPMLGDMVCIRGAFAVERDRHRPQLNVIFHGDAILENRGPSKRFKRRRRALEELRDDVARCRNRPRLMGPVQRIVLVTGPRSRAIGDFKRALERGGVTGAAIEVLAVDLRDAQSIADGITAAAERACDVVVVTRGGGDRDTLRPLDSAVVAAAVVSVATTLPIIVAVAHVDDGIAAEEFATVPADRTPTPTAAGSYVARVHQRFARSQAVGAPQTEAPHAQADSEVGARGRNRVRQALRRVAWTTLVVAEMAVLLLLFYWLLVGRGR